MWTAARATAARATAAVMINNDWYIDDRSHLGSSEKLEGRSETVTEISRMSHSWPVTKNDVMIKEVLETRKSRTVFHKIKGKYNHLFILILITCVNKHAWQN